MGQIGLNGQALALHSLNTDGFIYRKGSSTFVSAATGTVDGPVVYGGSTKPTSKFAPGVAGQLILTSEVGVGTYLYACTATGTAAAERWGRLGPLATFT